MESPGAWWLHCMEKLGANQINQSNANRGGAAKRGSWPETSLLICRQHCTVRGTPGAGYSSRRHADS